MWMFHFIVDILLSQVFHYTELIGTTPECIMICNRLICPYNVCDWVIGWSTCL